MKAQKSNSCPILSNVKIRHGPDSASLHKCDYSLAPFALKMPTISSCPFSSAHFTALLFSILATTSFTSTPLPTNIRTHSTFPSLAATCNAPLPSHLAPPSNSIPTALAASTSFIHPSTAAVIGFNWKWPHPQFSMLGSAPLDSKYSINGAFANAEAQTSGVPEYPGMR